ncbi:MAG TPA: ATP-binding cassette domain-containing protein, partial [Egibacteraceae bacterium]|nr:ATP-binding cassette domain-containing protein [Egibacteraceae bacterium]
VGLLATGAGGYQPAYFPLVGLVAPPRVRSQAYAWAILFVGTGGLMSILLFSLAETSGYRTAMTLLAFITAVASLTAMSAARFVRRDIAQAEQALGAAQRLREEFAATGSRALLVCRGVEVAYDQVQVLFGVDLEVQPGECVALLGTNGAGKSTLLRAISGTHDPSGGVIFFDGRDITHADANQTAAAGIAQVPGGKAVFPTLTVAEHLRAAGWLYRAEKDYLARATAEVFQTFPRLKEREHQLAGDLSGGEQQMLGLGMAFIAKPKLLMIDELSLGLAPAIVEQLLKILRRIQAQGTAIVLVEQSVNVALTVADRAYFLEKGEVRFEGPTADLLERPDVLRSVFLEGAARGRAAGAGEGAARGRAAGAGEGAATRGVSTPSIQDGLSRHTPGAPLLDVYGLTKRFGGIRAVDDATFRLHEGEILGLIGPNGAGKTTIFDLVSGFLVPDGGRIVVGGQDITGMAADRRAWLGLGRSFQDARLVPSLTVAENLALGLERHLPIRDHVAAALGLPMVLRQEEDVAWTVADLVELMGLEAYRDKFVRELSTGTRRIVDLAMCIAHEPRVLLLDEPSSGIAQRETEALGPLLRRIQAETGCALLVIEHDMPLITSISDRMIALELGHPIAEGTPAEVVRDARVVASYLGGGGAATQRSGPAALAGVGEEE